MGQSRRNAVDASRVCCSGGGGREVGQEQQAQARRRSAAFYAHPPHCLTKESYLEKKNASWESLLLLSFPIIDSWDMGCKLMRYLTLPTSFVARLRPRNTRESEGQCSEAWSRGWPLVSAERAACLAWREGVRFGERKSTLAMHGSLPLSKNQTSTTTFARSSGSGACPLRISSSHPSWKATNKRSRSF